MGARGFHHKCRDAHQCAANVKGARRGPRRAHYAVGVRCRRERRLQRAQGVAAAFAAHHQLLQHQPQVAQGAVRRGCSVKVAEGEVLLRGEHGDVLEVGVREVCGGASGASGASGAGGGRKQLEALVGHVGGASVPRKQRERRRRRLAQLRGGLDKQHRRARHRRVRAGGVV